MFMFMFSFFFVVRKLTVMLIFCKASKRPKLRARGKQKTHIKILLLVNCLVCKIISPKHFVSFSLLSLLTVKMISQISGPVSRILRFYFFFFCVQQFKISFQVNVKHLRWPKLELVFQFILWTESKDES